jgi:hypothetical protein
MVRGACAAAGERDAEVVGAGPTVGVRELAQRLELGEIRARTAVSQVSLPWWS